jgi:hypothetical protein
MIVQTLFVVYGKIALFLICGVVRSLFWDMSVSLVCSCVCCVRSVPPISMVARPLLRLDLIFSLRVPRLGPVPREASAGQLLFLLTNPNLWSPARVPGSRPVLRFSEPVTYSGTADLEFSAKICPFLIST